MANKYNIRPIGDPKKTERDFNKAGRGCGKVYFIYNSKMQIIGYAEYCPSFYKSQYSISYYPSSFPARIKQYLVARDGSSELKGTYSAGGSAKNPTAVLKQFKTRYEGMMDTLSQSITRGTKAKRKLKKSGLSASDYEKLGKYQAYIKTYQDSMKKHKREIAYAKDSIKSDMKWIKEFKSRIAKLKKK